MDEKLRAQRALNKRVEREAAAERLRLGNTQQFDAEGYLLIPILPAAPLELQPLPSQRETNPDAEHLFSNLFQ